MNITLEKVSESYDITIGRGVLHRVGELIPLDRRVLIVTDTKVPHEYAEAVAAHCRFPEIVRIASGEESKNIENYKMLLMKMLETEFNRHDCVVAVGGGVVGDLSCFAASTYMRGIDFYNIPTTLLSQVDSSIGGKSAIDFGGIKNSVGAFYQPKSVLIDPDVLKTLDPRQLNAGLAESVKMAATCDVKLFELFEWENAYEQLEEVIRRSLEIKKHVVESDPKETGLRKVLNFGHTVGHAIESAAAGRLIHGECVALGMLPMCSQSVRQRLEKVLVKYDLPTVINEDTRTLAEIFKHDKKAEADGINTVVVNELGSFEFVRSGIDDICMRIDAAKRALSKRG